MISFYYLIVSESLDLQWRYRSEQNKIIIFLMMNTNHLKSLLKKDFLTLFRSKGYLAAFVLLPILLMWAQGGITKLVEDEKDGDGLRGGDMVQQTFKYVSNLPLKVEEFETLMPFGDIPPLMGEGKIYASMVTFCGRGPVAREEARAAGENINEDWDAYDKIAIISPDADVRKNAVEYFEKYVYPKIGFTDKGFKVEGMESQEQLFNHVREEEVNPYCMGLYFKSFDLETHKFEVEYSFNAYTVPSSSLPPYNELQLVADEQHWNQWANSGILIIEQYVMEFIARSYKNKATPADTTFSSPLSLYDQEVGFAAFKSVEYTSIDPGSVGELADGFPFYVMIVFLIPFYYLTSKIASEKESKAREGMKMMGLQDSVYYLSWFILYGSITIIASTLATLMASRFFSKVDLGLFWIFLVLYGLSLYGQAWTVVAIFPTRKTSGTAASLFSFITYELRALVRQPTTPSSVQYLASVFPNICLARVSKMLFFFNYNTREGLKVETASADFEGYSFNGGIGMLCFNVVFWILLGFYLDQVVPSEYGVAKPWNFLCGGQKKVKKTVEIERKEKKPQNFEEVTDHLKKQEIDGDCLKVKGLVKQFGEKTAVAGVDLEIYKGQIFALLGHNGAGKTTTLSMLTGLLEPDAGQAEVFGNDIFENMDELRKDLGVCPQHDVLFEFLTPEDHLRLFAAFKGTPPEIIEDQVQKMLGEIDLLGQKTQLSKTLSGGQKRKLSVAIAMIGNSKIVMLDEPTSGMDTSARRNLWEMLKNNKDGRIVVLTTHYMDEADVLGDRIAIMAEGNVQCTGSSLFLKKRYGVGYNLVIAKKSREPAPQVDEFIKQRIKEAVQMQEVSREISYQLPTEASSQFKEFFKEFDENLDKLGIGSYGVGITTLEEVFLRIGHGEDDEDQQFTSPKKQAEQELEQLSALDKELEDYSFEQGETSNFFDHTLSITKKKLRMQLRNRMTLFVEQIFPVLLIIAGLAFATIAIFDTGEYRGMTPDLFPKPVTIFNNLNSAEATNADIDSFIKRDFMKQSSSLFEQKQGTPILPEMYSVPLEESTVFVDTATGKPVTIDPTSLAQDPMNPDFLDENCQRIADKSTIMPGQVQNIFKSIKQLDKYVFDSVEDKNVGSQWCSVFVNSLARGCNKKYSSVMLLNITSPAVAGVFVPHMQSAYLQHYLISEGLINPDSNLNVTFIDHNLPISKAFESIQKASGGITSAFLMAIAWMMVGDSQIQAIIRERERDVKHQIMISGCSLSAYWMGNYIADIINQGLLSIIAIVCIHAFGLDIPKVEALFAVATLANPPFIYFVSFLFKKEEAGSIFIKMVHFVFGLVAPIAFVILQFVNEKTRKIYNLLRWFCYPTPIFSLIFGYINISNREILQWVNDLEEEPKIFSKYVSGYSMIFLGCSIPFFWLQVALFENKVYSIDRCFRGKVKSNQVDAIIDKDVLEEEERVKSKNPEDLKVRLHDFQKVFGDVTACKRVSFGLEYGECFALLGISGAGKTTCFKSLTGEIYPTKGQVHVHGQDITTMKGFNIARKQIGYCPQFDSIFEGLTVKEHLEIYASLKGIKKSLRAAMVEKQMKDMDLKSYEHTRANQLSGGNKRKMSVAMALIGNPPLVFLDEPSTGVDPQAKRFMWNIVSKISTLRKKSAVIITTHSMEEAEALCTKMGIMVAGEFKCFGPAQHVKDKFGKGYEFEVKIRTLTQDEVNEKLSPLGFTSVSEIQSADCAKILQQEGNQDLAEELKPEGLGSEIHKSLSSAKKTVNAAEFLKWQFVESRGNAVIDHLEPMFEEFKIIEHTGNSWKIKVSRDNYSIGYLFGLMEDMQQPYDISEYSVTQTTLEQIFNMFARQAEIEAGGINRAKSLRRSSTTGKEAPNTIAQDNQNQAIN